MGVVGDALGGLVLLKNFDSVHGLVTTHDLMTAGLVALAVSSTSAVAFTVFGLRCADRSHEVGARGGRNWRTRNNGAASGAPTSDGDMAGDGAPPSISYPLCWSRVGLLHPLERTQNRQSPSVGRPNLGSFGVPADRYW